jgi:hypothetical protein
MPMMKRPPESWSNIAACAATSPGCTCGRFSTPVPRRIWRVRGMTVARKMSGDVIRSLHDEKCSPTYASLKPRRSARITAS